LISFAIQTSEFDEVTTEMPVARTCGLCMKSAG
jgi:bacterioferritin-associated ferredoxin